MRSLLSPGWAVLHRALVHRLKSHTPEGLAHAIGQMDGVALRVLAIDQELEAAMSEGASQLVILGAGLDTRAFRLPWLSDVTVFEVDHPATQTYKRKKAIAIPVLASSLRYVPVNFERDALSDKLAAAGHRADLPTVWIWEGVVMYLGDAALQGTLTSIAAASAGGSTLLVHYHDEVQRSQQKSREQRIRRLLLSFWGEPQIGLRSPAAMRAAVTRAGFEVKRDTRTADWALSLGARPPLGQTAAVSHLLVASRL